MKEDLKNDTKFKNVSNRIGHIKYTLYMICIIRILYQNLFEDFRKMYNNFLPNRSFN